MYFYVSLRFPPRYIYVLEIKLDALHISSLKTTEHGADARWRVLISSILLGVANNFCYSYLFALALWEDAVLTSCLAAGQSHVPCSWLQLWLSRVSRWFRAITLRGGQEKWWSPANCGCLLPDLPYPFTQGRGKFVFFIIREGQAY